MSRTVWGKRFEGRETVPVLERFNASISADSFLFSYEVRASSAFARALRSAGALSEEDLASILAGLAAVERRDQEAMNLGQFEDVHSAVEILLVEEIGEAGKRLHTGRSRNEQVVTDERLFLKEEIPGLIDSAAAVQKALVALAERHRDVIMPGYTHLQRGQPILFAHYILSFFWAIERGKKRLWDALARVDVLPLGSSALAGSGIPLDREELRRLLGFSGLSENSIDAVGDRSFILETLFALTLLLVDLSRLAEDFVVFSSAEFGFLDLDPAVATSSSLMPQKKNPDIFELLRAAPAGLFSHLCRLLMVLKGSPSSYNKDLQEDKEPLAKGVEEARAALAAAAAALERVEPNAERMRAAVTPDMFATDLVDWLVAKGVPFRDAYGFVASAIRAAQGAGRDISSLAEGDWAAIHPLFAGIPADFFDPATSIGKKRTPGSTHPDAVCAQLEEARRILGKSGVEVRVPRRRMSS
jgi:argininosuccinate lyase